MHSATVWALLVSGSLPSVAMDQQPVSATIDNYVGTHVQLKCHDLADVKIAATNLLSATIVNGKLNLPLYCRVLGYIRPAVNFEIRLPISNWNGKFYMAGCGGMCGSLETADQIEGLAKGLSRGYAVATMDGGHWGASPFDARFAVGNPIGMADFGYRAVHAATEVSKILVAEFYGRGPLKSFFEGCSTGGRQGLVEAQRYPADFDAIIAGSPAFDAAGLMAYWTWISQSDGNLTKGWVFPATKIHLLRDAVIRQCGDADGLIEDPRACHLHLESLACAQADNASCLTAAESTVVQRWYDGPKGQDGAPLYTDGVPYGSEPFWNRAGMPPAFGNVLNFQKNAADFGLRYLMIAPAPGELFDTATFDLNRDMRDFRAADAVITPTPDIHEFAALGGKLMIYQGWADPITPPLRAIAYYSEASHALGASAALQRTLRLFMIPGFNHCGGDAIDSTPGIDARGMDALGAMEKWSAGSSDLDEILSSKLNPQGVTIWQRPICSYPHHAVFNGSGDRRAAESWTCAAVVKR